MERTGEIDAMRQIPACRGFLARLGHEPVRKAATSCGISPRTGASARPFPRERGKTALVRLRYGQGFTLAGEFIGSGDFMEQVKFIAETANIPMPVPEVSKPTFQPKPSEPAFEDVETAPLFRSPLTDYLAERGISHRCRITLLLPSELRSAWQTVFRRWLPEYDGRI